jgi:hypothetical protein
MFPGSPASGGQGSTVNLFADFGQPIRRTQFKRIAKLKEMANDDTNSSSET